jgi:hypothetical protein
MIEMCCNNSCSAANPLIACKTCSIATQNQLRSTYYNQNNAGKSISNQHAALLLAAQVPKASGLG